MFSSKYRDLEGKDHLMGCFFLENTPLETRLTVAFLHKIGLEKMKAWKIVRTCTLCESSIESVHLTHNERMVLVLEPKKSSSQESRLTGKSEAEKFYVFTAYSANK